MPLIKDDVWKNYPGLILHDIVVYHEMLWRYIPQYRYHQLHPEYWICWSNQKWCKKIHCFLCLLIIIVVYCCCSGCCCLYSQYGAKSIECACVCIISLPPVVQQRKPCCTVLSHNGSSYAVVESTYNVTDGGVRQLKSWFTPSKGFPLNVVVLPRACGGQPFCWLGVLWCDCWRGWWF